MDSENLSEDLKMRFWLHTFKDGEDFDFGRENRRHGNNWLEVLRK
jgi:hypothetical protein